MSSVSDSQSCRFGPGCTFLCHCASGVTTCDQQTGECPEGCENDDSPSSLWHGPGCQIGE